jgi:hypothetical protein
MKLNERLMHKLLRDRAVIALVNRYRILGDVVPKSFEYLADAREACKALDKPAIVVNFRVLFRNLAAKVKQ